MIFSGMNLTDNPANSRTVIADYDKQIFCDESNSVIRFDDFDVCKPLAICTYLILTFYNQNALVFQYPVSLTTAISV